MRPFTRSETFQAYFTEKTSGEIFYIKAVVTIVIIYGVVFLQMVRSGLILSSINGGKTKDDWQDSLHLYTQIPTQKSITRRDKLLIM